MQLNTSAAFANTVTPYTPLARPSGSAVPAAQYTPSFPPVDHPSSLDYARHSASYQPVVYVPDLPGKPASKETERSRAERPEVDESSASGEEAPTREAEGQKAAREEKRPDSAHHLSEAELEEIEQLVKRDRDVKAHEQAHATVGGKYAGTPSYSFKRGPDGVSYAVAGEVPIDVSPVAGDPEATIRKMQQVQRAALAPAEPSGQDRAVAATAARQLLEARADLVKLRSGSQEDIAAQGSVLSSEKLSASREPSVESAQMPVSDVQTVRGIQAYRDLSLLGEVIREKGLWTQPLLDVVA